MFKIAPKIAQCMPSFSFPFDFIHSEQKITISQSALEVLWSKMGLFSWLMKTWKDELSFFPPACSGNDTTQSCSISGEWKQTRWPLYVSWQSSTIFRPEGTSEWNCSHPRSVRTQTWCGVRLWALTLLKLSHCQYSIMLDLRLHIYSSSVNRKCWPAYR